MGRDAPALRLFVAAYPPAETQRRYVESVGELGPALAQDYRTTPPQQLHLTLQFIGQVQARDLGEIVESVERSVSGLTSFAMTPRRQISLPERGTPRLVALEFDAPAALLEIHRRLVQRLARSPRQENPDWFLPHMTLLRYGNAAKPTRIERAVTLRPFDVSEIVLVRSVLKPGGAEHVPMERFSLG